MDDDLARLVTGKGYSNIDNWINGITDATKRAEIHKILNSWDNDLDGLIGKLDDAIKRYSGLSEELIADTKLLSLFKGINDNWWYKYGLLREHYRTAESSFDLPDAFRAYTESLSNRTGTVSISSRLSPGNQLANLGDMLEEDIMPLITEGFRTGDFTGLPQKLITELEKLRNEGYQIIMTQVKVSSSYYTGAPELDALLVRFDDIDDYVDFDDCVFLDIKLNANTSLDGSQLNLAKNGRGKVSKINDFVNHQNTPASLHIPDNIEIPGVSTYTHLINRNITITKTVKVGTVLDDDIYSLILKNYRPRN